MVPVSFSRWTASMVLVAGVTGCGSSAAKHSGSDGGSSGFAGASSGGNAGNDSLPHTDALSIDSVTAVVGLHGDDVRITVEGVQNDVRTLLSLEVTLLDQSSKPITFFDTNLNGRTDPGPGRLVLDAPPTSKSFVATGTILIAGRLGPLTQVSVRLISTSNGASDASTTTVAKQPIVGEGESCDPKGLVNRCAQGTGCTGSKPKCTGDILPQIDRSACLSTNTGARVIAIGSDTANPLASMNVEFLDKMTNR